MKTGLFILTLIIGIGMSWQSWAQPGVGRGRGMGPGSGGRLYDPQTEVTVKGQVTDLGELRIEWP